MENRKKIKIHIVLTIIATLLLASCAIKPPRGDSVSDEINKSLQQSTQQNAVKNKPGVLPPEVSAALMPPLNIAFSGITQTRIERRFDITVDRANARTFFMSLAKDTPYSMVVHPDVTGKISLSMKNVIINDVMETVRNVYGYEFNRTNNGYEILPTTLRSKIFTIDYLNVKRSGLSNVRVSSGQVQVSQKNRSDSGKANDNANTNNNGASKNTAVSGSQVNTRSESNFWLELTVALQAIIGSEEGRKVIVNAQSGIIVVRAMPAELRAVSQYLQKTQKIIERQVILEAKILEVELSDGFQSGINWSALGSKNGDSVIAGQFGGSSAFTSGVSNLQGQTNALNPANLADLRSDVASAFGGMFAMSLNIGNFTGFLEFLETQGDVHVLSSPRISTVSNQKAVIKVGTDEFFVTDVNTNTNTALGGASANQSVNVELTPFFSGVALDVIPQISEDGMVTLHIHPSVSEVTERVKQINLSSTSQLSVPLALSMIRESDSIVRARSGQVVVIGGLMQNQTRNQKSSVPFLGDLPLIGGLFRHEKKITRKSELVILLRPIVVNNDNVWSEEMQKITHRFGKITQLGSPSVMSDGMAE